MCSNNKHTAIELEKSNRLHIYDEINYKKLRKEYGLLLAPSKFTDKVFY